VATSVNGKGSIQEFSPYAVGVIGANEGSEKANNIVYEFGLLLVLGSK
jgi:acetolactate synthase-1/2/3 large subunit